MDVAGQKVFYNIVLKLLSKKKKIVEALSSQFGVSANDDGYVVVFFGVIVGERHHGCIHTEEGNQPRALQLQGGVQSDRRPMPTATVKSVYRSAVMDTLWTAVPTGWT